MKYRNYLWNLLAIMMAAMLSVVFVSCNDKEEEEPIPSKNEIVQNLRSHKWTGSSTDYDVYSYGGATYTQTWTVYFTSDTEGVMHVKIVDRDSSLGTTKEEEHLDFTYTVDGTKIRLSGGSNFVFDYYGDFLMEGDDIFKSSAMTQADYTYLEEHKKGGTDGPIDTEVFVINDSEILMGVNTLENGWYSYVLQFGFGANSDEAYKKGITQMKLTVWADNGCLNTSYKTYNYGKKKTYTLYLSSTKRDWYDLIWVNSKDTQVTFNYKLEYYNSNNGQWYDVRSRKLTFTAK